jgi:hypothetical protein
MRPTISHHSVGPSQGSPARFVRLSSLILFSTLLPVASLIAHNSPNSSVMLDFHRDGVAAELTLPLVELELSFKQLLAAEPAAAFAKHRDALKTYVLQHANPKAEDGRAWSVEVTSMTTQTNQQPNDLIVGLWMQPPAGPSPRKFNFNYSVINHEVMNHSAFVSVRNDWNTAVFSTKPEPLGSIHFTITSLQIDRTRGNWWQGFRSVLNLGIHHIADGTDHLLFLLDVDWFGNSKPADALQPGIHQWNISDACLRRRWS